MPAILLATKTRIPSLQGNLVSRSHLIQRLNQGITQNHRLTLVSAPAGYGKSTLLSKWVSQLDQPVAWLSLEKGDNTPTRFWSYFLNALSTLPQLQQVGSDESLFDMLQSSQSLQVDGLLTRLVNELSRLDDGAVLVLDDLHTITDGKIYQDLALLIEHLPRSADGLHLVVASRMDPPWPLARWRGKAELTELRASDLRFSSQEVSQFLEQVFHLKLSPHEIAALQKRIEGWAVGLQMAAVSMQGKWKAQGVAGLSSFITTLSGSNRFILDYLMDEVVNQQTEDVRSFLQATSILEQFTAPLCDALLVQQDSQVILDQVEQENLFLIPLDDDRQWYRYHHLFADLLRKSLKQTKPEIMNELHQRASDWYAENHFLAEAISHALDAGDILRVNRLVSGNALAMVEHMRLLDVLNYFELMPEDEICSKPWLCVAYAWVKAYVDPSQEIGRILEKAMESLRDVEDALESQHLISHLDAIWAYVAWVKGEATTALEFAHTALENLPDEDWTTRCHVLHTQGSALQYLGRLDEAIQSFNAVIITGQKANRVQDTFYAYTSLAFVNILQGHLHQAYSLCQQVLTLADQAGLVAKRLPVLAYAYATMSMVQREWNELGTAIYNAREGVALAEQWRQADTLHFSLTCLSEALCAAGERDEAFTANRRAMLLATDVSPWFLRLSASDEICLNLEKGDITAAARRFAELDSLVRGRARLGHFTVVKASLWYAQGRYAELVLELEESISNLKDQGDVWVLMSLLTLQALALQAVGREEEAVNVIGDCLDIAQVEGFTRVFVKQGAPMLRLLQAAAQRGIAVEYINKLIPAFNISVSPMVSAMPIANETRPQHPGATLIEPLSERELQVLRLLDSPLTSEQIGSELYVSVNTIRTHIRNIYAKLDVHGRLEAIQKARDLKLI